MEVKYMLNYVLNKALITERIKQPNSNSIADFVNKYLEAINHVGCNEEDLTLVCAPINGLILSPKATKERCEELYKKWVVETFK